MTTTYASPRLSRLRPALLCAALVLAAHAAALAQRRAPRFEDHPVREIYQGRPAPVRLTRDDRAFRTRLRAAAREKANFAGRYVLTTWGCGTGCQLGAAVDLRTGRVHWLPQRLCCWPYSEPPYPPPATFRLDSRLIALAGGRGETEAEEGEVGVHFYEFRGGRFRYLRTVTVEEHYR